MKAKELREKSAEELKALKLDCLKEQFNLRMQQSTEQQSVKTHLFKQARRNVARINTILTEMDTKAEAKS